LIRVPDPRLLVGFETSDDAGVVQLTPELALVQTVDFFTPIVDDPYWFGRIAAANALSDVYAMGGTPLSALNIVGFPEKDLELSVLAEILRGGQDALKEAGALLLGGHTVSDPELKYGLAVTGTIHPAQIFTNAAARPGDLLVLTKPLGTGIVCTALKRGVLPDDELERVTQSMARLNAGAARAMRVLGAHAATDITGFGLLGHGMELARGSGVSLEIDLAALPLLPRTLEYAAAGHITGGGRKNLEYVRSHIVGLEGLSEAWTGVLADPQTSGGLLLSIPPEREKDITAAMVAEGVEGAVVIGRVLAGKAFSRAQG
jgi:selenide,water dikinase